MKKNRRTTMAHPRSRAFSIAAYAVVFFTMVIIWNGVPPMNDMGEDVAGGMWMTMVQPSRGSRLKTFVSLDKASTTRLDCEDGRTDAIFLIFSTAASWRSRANLRDTLLSPRSKSFFHWTGVFFVQGAASPGNDTVSDKTDEAARHLASEWLAVESDVMEDVVSLKPVPRHDVGEVVSAADSYLSALEWAADHCQSARYVIKMSDNVAVDPTRLRRYLKWSVDYKASRLHCRLASMRPPGAEVGSAVTHCRGDGAVIMTQNSIKGLLTAYIRAPENDTQSTQQSEEAYVTGDLALASNIDRQEFTSVDEGFDADVWAPMNDAVILWPQGDNRSGTNMMTTLGGKPYEAGIDRRALWYLAVWEATLIKPVLAEALPVGGYLRSRRPGVGSADEYPL